MGPIFQLLGSILLDPFTPDQVQSCSIRKFRWRTTYLARIAAGVTGVFATVALHQSPHIQSDLMFGSSSEMVNLITFSIGVWAVNMVIHRQFSLLTIHHLAVIACFYPNLRVANDTWTSLGDKFEVPMDHFFGKNTMRNDFSRAISESGWVWSNDTP